ncbi:methyl-accepting chemotaxis protein [Selenomonas ruminantium]|uniref:Methyl-accepting chemotaxis sensory transducer with TarH sensor n=1 Tax=Selenomonas ruminantium TaxID=971 RepID=A0A1H0MVU1_SELRU|nr:methyl-accepting chemotaxis protein [Selenomonas ruminantium]SDO84492.1 methyl-accepting chemotaxis sensory transducer with TarH sensor [Selenomonas ruminantium]
MSLKQKFMLLSGIMGLLMAVVAITGYIMASRELQQSVDSELRTTVSREVMDLDGWLREKRAFGVATTNYMTSLNGNYDIMHKKETLGTTISDKEILEMTGGTEDGWWMGFYTGDKTGKRDPRQRPWYKEAKAQDKVLFTDAYVAASTGKLVVSVAAPVKADGQFIGATCVDIALDAITEQVNKMKYHGEGAGVVMEKSGNILATSGAGEQMKNFKDIEGWGNHFDEIVKNGEGYFETTINGEEQVFAYQSVPSTGWIVGISVPSSFVFASLWNLKVIFLCLILGGLLVSGFVCRTFAGQITGPVVKLENHASQMANGNLKLEQLPVESADEIGEMTAAFNTMSTNLRALIHKMASTSEQVAAASEELTANAQQSAEASVHVAETVGEVSMSMEQQLSDIDGAKKNVDDVYADVSAMTKKAHMVSDTSNRTAEAAYKGSQLMENAVKRMGNIEQSVIASAEVVQKLGENSNQIGQIVEAISSIAEQTNLLSLNAAIEAARAGEHGRGFAVVAEEVRKLASESQDSAEQIKQRITSIQQDTAEAVKAMRAGTEEVKSGTAAIREVGEQFEGILTMVDGIKQQMDEINTSVNLVAEGTGNIVSAVDSIDGISRKTSEHTHTISAAAQEQSASNEEIAAASQALANMATDMQTAIGQFKL